MTTVRKEACSACPYRQDVPSGVWSAEEYDKLPPYDGEGLEQPLAGFACHATPDHFCHGWAVVGGWDLMSLRLHAASHPGSALEIPEPSVPLWGSHTEAAVHGARNIEHPDDEAQAAVARLLRKYPRLSESQ